MILTEAQIREAIQHTTGPGDWKPNAYRIKSWMNMFGGLVECDYGESFDQIARFIWEHYGVKTVTVNHTIAGHMDHNEEYYIRQSDGYTTGRADLA